MKGKRFFLHTWFLKKKFRLRRLTVMVDDFFDSDRWPLHDQVTNWP